MGGGEEVPGPSARCTLVFLVRRLALCQGGVPGLGGQLWGLSTQLWGGVRPLPSAPPVAMCLSSVCFLPCTSKLILDMLPRRWGSVDPHSYSSKAAPKERENLTEKMYTYGAGHRGWLPYKVCVITIFQSAFLPSPVFIAKQARFRKV